MTNLQIRGLKLSRKLCLVRLHHSASAINRLPAFLAIMAGSRINLPYVFSAPCSGAIQAACCVDAEHQTLIKQMVDADPMIKAQVSYIPEVGLLTLFPHQSSMKLFMLSLHTLRRENFRVMEIGSSIGALTYVLPYHQLDAAAEVLKSLFKLDGNHAPFRAETMVCQGTQIRPGSLE